MTFKEKSRKRSDGNPVPSTDDCSFTEVVDKAIDELMECKINYSIRRISELENSVDLLMQELDDFLKMKN